MKKSIIKNISLGIACLLGVGGVVAAASAFKVDKPFEVAQADDYIQFINRIWLEEEKEVKSMQGYIDTYTPVTSTTTSWTNEKWYVVNTDVTISSYITVTGDVHIIICDGYTLTAQKGIYVADGNTLSIYDQAGGTGAIVATGEDNASGIGGRYASSCNDVAGTINIYGGHINADGGNQSAGIGGSWSSTKHVNGGTVNIYSGVITATGNASGLLNGTAGIGGGQRGEGGLINIYGGTVEATGGTGAAGIGGGDCVGATGSSGCNGGTINIHGGTVTATAGGDAAAIGGGTNGNGGTINISGGTVTANARLYASFYGAGIGGGRDASGGTVTISGGKVTAIGGSYAKGIGAGRNNDENGELTVTNSSLKVYGGDDSTSMEEQNNYATTRWRYMEVKSPHTHEWSYAVNGSSLTAVCSGSGICPETEDLTLTISAQNYTYDGTAKTASVTSSLNPVAYPTTPTIEYYKGSQKVASCIDAGDYEARVTVGSATAIKAFSIAKANPTGYDIPTGLTATYGQILSDVTLPTNWAWKTPTDKVGNAGNREHIAIYTPENTNYNSAEETLTIEVAKVNPTYVVPTGMEAPYDVALSTVGLPEGFSWMDGTQKTSTWGENTFKAKYTPSDTSNYNVVENIDIKVNVKWILIDPTQEHVNVEINGVDDKFTVDITIKVEIKTEISVDQKRTDYANLANESFVNKNEDIAAIYGVKLIRTTNGVEEEIQPSDIKEGTKIIVSMDVPTELVGKDFRLLHIHNIDDINEVTNYALSKDGKTLMVEVDRLSEFAFIIATDTDNGFDYSIGLPGWALALIIIGSILLLGILALLILSIFFPVYYIDYSKKEVRRAIYIRTKDEMVLMINTRCQKVRRNETDVYKKKSDALKALNK